MSRYLNEYFITVQNQKRSKFNGYNIKAKTIRKIENNFFIKQKLFIIHLNF